MALVLLWMLFMLVAVAKILAVKKGTGIVTACLPCWPTCLTQPTCLAVPPALFVPAFSIFILLKWMFSQLICLEPSTSLRWLFEIHLSVSCRSNASVIAVSMNTVGQMSVCQMAKGHSTEWHGALILLKENHIEFREEELRNQLTSWLENPKCFKSFE